MCGCPAQNVQKKAFPYHDVISSIHLHPIITRNHRIHDAITSTAALRITYSLCVSLDLPDKPSKTTDLRIDNSITPERASYLLMENVCVCLAHRNQYSAVNVFEKTQKYVYMLYHLTTLTCHSVKCLHHHPHPPTWRMKIFFLCIINIIAADYMATQGAGLWVVMIMIWFWNIHFFHVFCSRFP